MPHKTIHAGPADVDPPAQGAGLAEPAPQVKPRSLGRNIVWYLVGNVLFSAGQWAMLVFLAKITSPEVVGLMTLARAITFPTLQFAQFNLRAVIASTTKGEFYFRDFFALRLVALPIAYLGILVWAYALNGIYVASIIALVGLAGVFDSLSDVIYGVFQQTENMNRISISRSIQGVLQLAGFIVIMLLTRDLLAGAAALAIISGLTTWFYDIRFTKVTLREAGLEQDKRFASPESRQFKPNFDFPKLWRLFVLAFPMALVMLFVALNFNIPRYFIEASFGLRLLGIFGAMTALMQAAALLQSAVGNSILPRLARYYDDDLQKYMRLFKQLMAAATVSLVLNVAISLLLGHWLLAKIYKPEYAQHVIVFHWLMLANGMFYIQAGIKDGLTAARNYTIQPWVQGIGSLSILLGAWILVPRYGMVGAAWSILIGMIVLALGFGIVLSYVLAEYRTLRGTA